MLAAKISVRNKIEDSNFTTRALFFFLSRIRIRRTIDRDIGRTGRLHRQGQHDKFNVRHLVQSGTAGLHFVESQRRGKYAVKVVRSLHFLRTRIPPFDSLVIV